MTMKATRAYAAELLGSALLLATVVGSGIMGERLAGGNLAVALLANAIATGGILYVLITGLGPVSGAHFNPVVTLIELAHRRIPRTRVPGYLACQVAGAFAGVLLAHVMFGVDVIQHGTHARDSSGELVSEVVATFGLWLVIATSSRARPSAVPAAVALYIVAAYWFTASTSFANPAVTLARAFTDTFANIRLADVPKFVAMQAIGAAAAAVVASWLLNSGVHPEAAPSSGAKDDHGLCVR
jgi:glycerol uptake facilitator-like aquaporin